MNEELGFQCPIKLGEEIYYIIGANGRQNIQNGKVSYIEIGDDYKGGIIIYVNASAIKGRYGSFKIWGQTAFKTRYDCEEQIRKQAEEDLKRLQ